jgi:hypothetical protein
MALQAALLFMRQTAHASVLDFSLRRRRQFCLIPTMPTFAEYLEKWLKQSPALGLTNPLVKMPVKRFRLLQPFEFSSLANGGTFIIGTMGEPSRR